jgi:hypothetical protein
MSSTNQKSADAISQQRDAFIEQFLQFASGPFNIFAIYIGDRLGLYRALAEGGRRPPPCSPLARTPMNALHTRVAGTANGRWHLGG